MHTITSICQSRGFCYAHWAFQEDNRAEGKLTTAFFHLQDWGCHKDMQKKAKQTKTLSSQSTVYPPSCTLCHYYAATFSQEYRHHSSKHHHTFFVFCIKRRVFLFPLITFFLSGLNLAQRGFHVLKTSVNGEGFLYMQFKTNYRVLHTYVDKACVMNDIRISKLALRILSSREKKRGSTKEKMYRAAPMKVAHAWNS
jgi:hypothetical protein